MRNPKSFRSIRSSTLALLAAVVLLAPSAACRGAEEVEWKVERPADVPRAALEIRFVAEGKEKAEREVKGPDGESLWVEKEIVISSSDVSEVHVGVDMDLEHYGVTLFFIPQAAQRLHDATSKNLGRQVAVLLNGFVMIAPRIQTPLGPSARISGNYTREAATKLAEQLAP